MAVKQIGNTIYVGAEELKEFIGTKVQQSDINTTTLAAGSSYWATDEKVGYVWDGEVWQSLS